MGEPVRLVAFSVFGKPATKGSWKIRRSDRGGVLVPDNERERPWAYTVANLARMAMNKPPTWNAVEVAVCFRFLKPKRPAHTFPVGDVDKLARSLLDALTGIAYMDDVQVIRLDATKVYVDKDPGCDVVIKEYIDA